MTETNKPTIVPSKTKFNFILENGLPYKYLLEPDFVTGYLSERNFYGIYANLSIEEVSKMTDWNFTKLHIIENSIWLELQDRYIVFEDLDAIIMKAIENKNLLIHFFDSQNNFINGIELT